MGGGVKNVQKISTSNPDEKNRLHTARSQGNEWESRENVKNNEKNPGMIDEKKFCLVF